MRSAYVLLAACVVALLGATQVGAQEGRGTEVRRERAVGAVEARPESRPGGPGIGQLPPLMPLAEAIKQLDLTAEQRTQIDQIMATHRQEQKNKEAALQAELKPIEDEIKAARDKGDRQAAQAAMEKLRALREKQTGEENLRKQIMAVLTPPQREKLGYMMSPAWGFDKFVETVKKLDLTEQQTKQLAEIVAQAKTDAKAVREGEGRANRPYAEALRKITEMLTEEQRAKLRAMAAERARNQWLDNLGLTDKQKQDVEKIMAEANQKANAEQDPQAKRRIMMEARQKVMNEVLTPEQKEKAQAQMRERLGAAGSRPAGERPAGARERPAGERERPAGARERPVPPPPPPPPPAGER